MCMRLKRPGSRAEVLPVRSRLAVAPAHLRGKPQEGPAFFPSLLPTHVGDVPETPQGPPDTFKRLGYEAKAEPVRPEHGGDLDDLEAQGVDLDFLIEALAETETETGSVTSM